MPEAREIHPADWRAKQPSQVARASEDLKCWRAWDAPCGHKAKDITPSTAWRRGVESGSVRRALDRTRKGFIHVSSSRATLEMFQRQHCSGNIWVTMSIRARRHTILIGVTCDEDLKPKSPPPPLHTHPPKQNKTVATKRKAKKIKQKKSNNYNKIFKRRLDTNPFCIAEDASP